MALLSALDGWMGQVDEGTVVGALLIDLSKAFDTLPHHHLLSELLQIGCGQKAMSWFTSYLTDREQRVTQGSLLSDWKQVSRGVPQGSSISPLLFNIFVGRLPAAVQSNTLQFADDVTHSEADVCPLKVISKLTESFELTKTFCDNHELAINTAKTQFILFKSPSKKLNSDLSITLDGCSIIPSEHVKLLGVTLDHHFTFSVHIDNTVKKARGVLGAIARAAPNLPTSLLRLAYISLVRSLLEYASATFVSASATQLNKLEVVQKMASRIICQVPRLTHSAPLLDSLHLESLGKRREDHVIKLVDDILNGRTHPALLRMFWKDNTGVIINDNQARIGIGRRRFSIFAKNIVNV